MDPIKSTTHTHKTHETHEKGKKQKTEAKSPFFNPHEHKAPSLKGRVTNSHVNRNQESKTNLVARDVGIKK
jgi:hypothetical protein